MSKNKLKKIVEPIILGQGNKYIKELLRDHRIPIGATKSDFSQNLMAAIDDGRLTQEVIEKWLIGVEGWGNQHIYLYEPLAIGFAALKAKIRGSKYSQLLEKPISYDFPDSLALTTITLTSTLLSFSWHVGDSGWVRTKFKDYQAEEGGDRFEYRAFRERFDRSVVRFEWHFANPYSAILIQLPNEGDLHSRTIAAISADLAEIGLLTGPLVKIALSGAFKSMNREPDVIVQSTRMTTDGGYLDLVSTLQEGGINDVEAVRQVHRAVDDSKFATADGMYNFRTETIRGLSRPIKVQGFGLESRIRVWVQCKREDIHLLITTVWGHHRKK